MRRNNYRNYDTYAERLVADKIANGEYLTDEEEAIACDIERVDYGYNLYDNYCGRRYKDI